MEPSEELDRIRAIDLIRVGSLPKATAERLAALISRHVAAPCRLRNPSLQGELILLPDRDQADTDYVLERLESQRVEPGTVLVGITTLDLALPIFTHVFGGARRNGHAAVVSLARLRPEFYGLPPDPDLIARRAVAEILHEVGHLAGLSHCSDYSCLMHFAPDVETIDLRGLSYCSSCSAALPGGLLVPPPV